MSRRSRGVAGRPAREPKTPGDRAAASDGDDLTALDVDQGGQAGGAMPTEQDQYQPAMDRSFRLLAVRGRTVAELSGRLRLAGFGTSTIDRVIERLVELQYLDDAAFALAWVTERGNGGRASGRYRLAWELAQKGVAKPLIDAALACYSPTTERAAALRIAEGMLGRKAAGPRDRLRYRIYQTLVRRGFDREAVDAAMATIGPQLADQQDRADDDSPAGRRWQV